MSTPVVELIAVDMLAALNEIRVANGYYQDLTAIRPRRVDYSQDITAEATVILEQMDPTLAETLTSNTRDWQQPFLVQVIALDIDDGGAIDTRINYYRSDIEKKLATDITRGGNAYRQEFGAITYFAGEGFAGVAIVVDVWYRTEYDDPYTAA